MIKKRIFVTGPIGFLGKFFLSSLLDQPEQMQVYVLTRDKGTETAEDRIRDAGLLLPNVTVVPGDVTDPDLNSLAATLPEMDEVWHIAGLTSFQESKRKELEQVNIHGTANILSLAQALRCKKFYHISTAYVAGKHDGVAIEDGLTPNPEFRNPYEETKYYGEQLVRASSLPWMIIRPSIIVGHSETGEADSDKMIYGVLRCCLSLKKWVNKLSGNSAGNPAAMPRYYMRGLHETRKNYVCVDDCVRMMLAVREKGVVGKTYHATQDTMVTLGQQLETISRLLGMDYLRLNAIHDECIDSKQKFINRGVSVYEPYMMYSDPVFDMTNAKSLGNWKQATVDASLLEFLFNQYFKTAYERERFAEHARTASMALKGEPSLCAANGPSL